MAIAVLMRKLTEDDQDFLWQIIYHAIYVTEGDTPPEPEVIWEPEIARYVTEWGRTGDFGFVATTEQHHPIGAVWLRLLTGQNRGYGWIGDVVPELTIAILPEYRGQGVGTALMAAVLSVADNTCDRVSLSVSFGNPAQRLYERFGFSVIGDDGFSFLLVRHRPQETFMVPLQ